jgi:type I restriction enzyme S subunit
MSEWKEYKLGEIANIQTGPFGSQLHQSDYVDVGIPSIMPVNIGDRMNISIEKIVYITEEDATRLSRYRVQEGDIVYSRRGDVEKCAYIGKAEIGWLCGTGCLRIRIDSSKADSKFIAYYLSTEDMKSWISNNAVGTTMPNLNSSILQQVPLSMPSLDEQKRIASILSSLDDKIDLLNRENVTLEAMAETLFRQWFIEEAKEDWEEGTISDLIDFNPTRRLTKDMIAPFLEMSNLSTSTYAPTYWYDRAFSSGTKFQNGDTLLARITPCLENGKTAYVDFLNEGQVGWGSTEFIVMCSKLGLHLFFSYAVAKYQDFRDYAESCMAGSSGRQRVDVENLKNYPISIPDEAIINRFNTNIESFVSKMQINNKQIRALKAQRDILLPKLMSNEISF